MADTNADFFKLTLTNTLDQTLELSDLANYVAEESDGFGMPPLARMREASPNLHGEIDMGFRLLPRKLKFRIKARGASPAGLYARRAELLKYFCPAIKPLVLTVHLPDGTQRCIKCHLESGLNFKRAERSGYVQDGELVLNCPDPAFYDPEPAIVNYLFKAGESLKSLAIPYAGSWRSYPLIALGGPWTNPVISHFILGTKISLTCALTAGQELYIDLNPESRSITDQDGVLKMQYLKSESSMTGFYIENLVSGPDQLIGFQGTGLAAGSWCYVQYSTRYIGI